MGAEVSENLYKTMTFLILVIFMCIKNIENRMQSHDISHSQHIFANYFSNSCIREHEGCTAVFAKHAKKPTSVLDASPCFPLEDSTLQNP